MGGWLRPLSRAAIIGVASAIFVLATLVTHASSAGADQGQPSAGAFSGTASADAVRVNVAIPDYLIIKDFVDGGGPSAQAQLDSLGTSQAFASFPYPGQTGVALTGLISLLTGVPLPSYPFIASSDFPTVPKRTIDQPGYHLSAVSDQSSSNASATFGEATVSGTAEAGGFSRASVTSTSDGQVLSHSEAKVDIVLGPVSLKGVDAVAQVTRAPDGTIVRQSSLSVARLDVAGVPIGLTDRGLVVGGATLVPMRVLTGVASTISVRDTKIELVPASTTADSVVSAGLRVTRSQMIQAIGHPVNLTYTIGGVFASADNSALAIGLGSSSPLPPVIGALLGSMAPAAPGLGPLTPAGGAVSSSRPLLARPKAGVPQQYEREIGIPLSLSAWTFFPVLAVAGVALLVGALGSRRRSREEQQWSF